MDSKELEILKKAEVRDLIERNIERDATRIALDKSIAYPREVASQVKYLQRARKKLPSYYAARAVLPSLAFEQSSSEECAAHKEFSGTLAIDMTCGLGVDTLYLSRRFERVVAIERNPELADITRHNLALMGANNVEIVVGDSGEYVASLDHADLIYADPDRRSSDGRKMVCLEDCSPNIASLLHMLRSKADNICVKLSPMFDLTEARRAFGPEARLEVVSLGGECKEVLVSLRSGDTHGSVAATALGVGTFEVEAQQLAEFHHSASDFTPEQFSHIVVPDAALRKAGLVEMWCEAEGMKAHGGYGFCTQKPSEKTMGHCYEIELATAYRPKELKRLVSGKIEVIRHGFPHPTAAICKALGIKEGAGQRWAFAEIGHSLWAFRLK